MIPKRRRPERMGVKDAPQIRSAGHLRWIRGFECSVGNSVCKHHQIEAAHVRIGTDGGASLKPGDNWTIPLCAYHHAQQHRVGETSFETAYKIDMKQIAAALWKLSPHRPRG